VMEAPAASSSAASRSASSSSSSVLRAAAAVVSAGTHSFAGMTVVEDVATAICAVKGAVAGDAFATALVSRVLPNTALEFFRKFSESSFVGAIAKTEASRVPSTDNVTTEEEAKAVDGMQKALTKAVEGMRFNALLHSGTVAEAVRLANCSWEGAPLTHYIRPMEAALTLRDWEVSSMKRHQYGLVPVIAADRQWYCKCGHAVTEGHNHTCLRIRGPATFHRHQCVVMALADVAERECGLIISFTPRVYADVKDKDEDSYVVPDITFSGRDFKLAIDVSAVYGESTSYLPAEIKDRWSEIDIRRSGAVEAREGHKKRHYANLPESGECEFMPFVFESHGGLGQSAIAVIDRLAEYGAQPPRVTEAEMKGYIKRIVAVAIQRGNAGLDSVAREKQAGSYGAAVARGMVAGRLD